MVQGVKLGSSGWCRYARKMAALPIAVYRLGVVSYREAWAWQQARAAEVRARRASEALVVVEHASVITCGRSSDPAHLLAAPEQLEAAGIEVVDVDRGGDVTYHGPGQLVAYPILNLRKRGMYPISFVRALERTIVATLAELGVPSELCAGRPGVWVGKDKIASLGVHLSGGVTTHGISINIDPDLTAFEAIVSCGLHDAGVTSVARYCGIAPGADVAKETFVSAFARTFEVDLVDAERELVMVHDD